MSDYIKRADAIKAVTGWDECPSDEELEWAINRVPTVERKRGEWIFNDPLRADFECSECLERNDICTNFCPNCGADMRGESDEKSMHYL